MINTKLKDKLSTLPMEPGCYIMKDKDGTIIYVGKAKKLKNRVNQYFMGAHDYKTTKLVSQIVDFDTIVTSNEKESLILEINLIKKHRPRFNIMFMDDKSYPYIKITQEKYPKLTVVREQKKDKKANYYGPFPDAGAAYNMASLLNSIYPLRKCGILPKKVCLYYHLGQCLGPCVFKVEDDVYPNMIKEIVQVLKGDDKALRLRLNDQMRIATETLNYEKAMIYRDFLRSLDHVLDKQNVNNENRIDRDAFNYYEKEGMLTITALIVRGGQLMDRHLLTQVLVDDASESFENFILQYYATQPLPKEVLVPSTFDTTNISSILNVKVLQPQRGELKKLMDLVLINAMNHHRQNATIVKKNNELNDKALNELKSRLNLDSVNRIELYDNSHISGQFASSACVVFVDGSPSKKDYRLYNLHNGADDVKNMEEVIYRRFLRAIKENQTLPNLILMDGGYTQVQAAIRSMESLDVHVPIYGLVKDDKHTTSALMDQYGDRIELKDQQETFFLLSRMQDEVHRFVLAHHQKRRSKAQTKSILEEIEGVGPKRRLALLKAFKSVQGILDAPIEKLEEVVGKSLAKELKKRIQEKREMV
jgi:excinuclease ABC subunit C